MTRLARRQVIALAAAFCVLLVITAGALAVTGDLTQPAGTAGCISETGAGNCVDGHALSGANGVAVSGDGKNVYATSYVSNAVARLSRNTTTGALSQPAGSAGCVSQTGAGPCAQGHGLDGVYAVAVSGKSVYLASSVSDAVVRLNRNTTTGAITQPAGSAGCVSNTGAEGCALGHALDGAVSVAVSPDGKNVYATSGFSNAVAILDRNTTTGAITQPAGTAGCVSETGAGPCADGRALAGASSVAVSSDGKSVYVASLTNGVARFDRDTTTGALSQPAGTAGCINEDGSDLCADGHGIQNPISVAVSPDGKSVYAVSTFNYGVVRLNRDTTTGAIGQPAGTAGCISENGSGPCADGHGLAKPRALAVSKDGKSLYVVSIDKHALAVLKRNTTTGAISQAAGTTGCISENGGGGCANGHALLFPLAVTVAPGDVYTASYDSKAVAHFNRAP